MQSINNTEIAVIDKKLMGKSSYAGGILPNGITPVQLQNLTTKDKVFPWLLA